MRSSRGPTRGGKDAKVPSATYDAVVVLFTNNKKDEFERVEVEAWFADKVGMVKQRIRQNGQEHTLELEKFTPKSSYRPLCFAPRRPALIATPVRNRKRRSSHIHSQPLLDFRRFFRPTSLSRCSRNAAYNKSIVSSRCRTCVTRSSRRARSSSPSGGGNRALDIASASA